MSRSGQTENFVFRQAQEMFPQLEPEVVYIVLSENNFNIGSALDQLSILCSSSSVNITPESRNGLEKLGSTSCGSVAPSQMSHKSDSQTSSSLVTKPLSKNAKKRARKRAKVSKNKHPQALTKQMVLSNNFKDLSLDNSKHSNCSSENNCNDPSSGNDPMVVAAEEGSNLASDVAWDEALPEEVRSIESNRDPEVVEEAFQPKKIIVSGTDRPPSPIAMVTEKDVPGTIPEHKKDVIRYIFTHSYISVGQWNGMRLQFNGDGTRQPCLVNGSSSMDHLAIKFNDSDKLLPKVTRVKKDPVGFAETDGAKLNKATVDSLLDKGKSVTPDKAESPEEANDSIEFEDIDLLKLKLNEACNGANTMKRHAWSSPRPNFHQQAWSPRGPYHGFYSPGPQGTGPRHRFNSSPFVPMPPMQRFPRPNLRMPKGRKTLFILRGAPGSGKSTLARQLAGSHGLILSTDDYFIQPNGCYVFDPMQLQEAHMCNQKNATKALQKGRTPVIIDNTNMTAWEMAPYVIQGAKNNYDIQIREPNTPWKFKAQQLARKNTHGVPKETIVAMLERYEKNVTVQSILKASRERMKNKFNRNSPPNHQQSPTPTKQQTSKKDNLSIKADVEIDVPNDSQHKMDAMDSFDDIYLSSECSEVEDIMEDLNIVSVDDKNDIYESDKSEQEDKVPETQLVANYESGDEEKLCEMENQLNFSDTAVKQHLIPDIEQNFISDNVQNSISDTEQGSEPKSSDELYSLLAPEAKDEQTPETSKGIPYDSSSTKRKKQSKRQSSQPQSLLTDIHFESDWGDFLKSIESPQVVTSATENLPTKSIETKSNFTWTDPQDFVQLGQFESELCSQSTSNFRLLPTNPYSFIPASISDMEISSSLLNKSTSTEDLKDEQAVDVEADIATLRELFPHISVDHLRDIYAKCGDLHWATDVIAESSLFGTDENILLSCDPRTSPVSVPSSPKTIDDYYDTVLFDVIQQTTPEIPSKPVADDVPTVPLTLPYNFLRQVAEFAGESLPPVNTQQVELNMDMALDLYFAWRNANSSQKPTYHENGPTTAHNSAFDSGTSLTLGNILSDEAVSHSLQQIEDDERLARRLQMEENHGMRAYQKSSQNPSSPATPSRRQQVLVGVSNQSLWSPGQNGSPRGSGQSPFRPFGVNGQWSTGHKQHSDSLTQIMKEEKAAEASQKKQQAGAKNMQLAAQMKRDQLKVLYPRIPEDLLNDIFKKNGYNMEETMYEIACIWSDEDSHIFSTFTSGSILPDAEHTSKPAASSNAEKLAPEDDPVLATLDNHNLTYEELRSEAIVHRKEMHECHRKAAAANHQSRGALAVYYASQAQLHKKYLREANSRAAAITYKLMNEGRSKNELDLHGLHVDEAIDTLRSVIAMKRTEKERHLFVITGWGRNSATGTSRIKSAVTEWLKQSSISFVKVNEGYLKISL